MGARSILDEGGVAEFTVDALARTLHMSKSTLYKYFDGKDHVLVVLVDEVCDSAERAISACPREGAPIGALGALAGVMAGFVEDAPGAILIDRENLPEISRERLAGTRSRFYDAATALIDKADLGDSPAELGAAAWLAALEAGVEYAARHDYGRGAAVRKVHSIVATGLNGTSS